MKSGPSADGVVRIRLTHSGHRPLLVFDSGLSIKCTNCRYGQNQMRDAASPPAVRR